MHIIKTAFKKAWPASLDNSILLGDWCINEDSVDTNEIDKLKIIDYHFNDRKKLNASRKEINAIYDEFLKILTSSLNKLFNKNNNKRYWEIIWGWWLYTFILVIYDRNLSISKVLKMYPKSITNILNPKSYIIAYNTRDYLDNIQNDFFNFQIYSSLWNKYEGNVNSIITNSYKTKKTINSIYYYCKMLLVNFCRTLFKLIFKKSNIISFSTGFPKKTLLKIIFKSKFKVVPFELFVNENIKSTKKINQDLDLRNELKDILVKHKKKNNHFLNICLIMISEHAPLSILEGYKTSVKINRRNINKCNFLFSSNGFINDQWNILCAEHINNGAKLINSQHGGGYGIQKFSGFEDYEIRVADKFITTGWKLKPKHKFIPMPLPFVNKNKHNKINKNGKIFYIRNDYPRYLYRIFSHPVGKYVGLYRKWSGRFLQKLDKKVLSNTLVRFYPIDLTGTHDSFKQKHQEVKYDDYIKTFDYQLKNCKIAISDTNQTTFLESIALDIPTIIFWNPLSTEIKREAKPLIDMLNKVEILHYSPESAANFLNLNHENINKWWMSNEVREARASFISNYANLSNNWEYEWVDFFKKYLSE